MSITGRCIEGLLGNNRVTGEIRCDILSFPKGRGFLISQEWVCIATAHWFLLLTALQHYLFTDYPPDRPQVNP